MNKLRPAKRVQILAMLCEGSSMRSVSCIAEVSINTVTKLLCDAGVAALQIHENMVCNVKSKRIQCDEIWSFCYAEESVEKATSAPEEAGHIWTWTAIDTDSKLILSYLVGNRSRDSVVAFITDLRMRIRGVPQITTDNLWSYQVPVKETFSGRADFAQLLKRYHSTPTGADRYSPGELVEAKKRIVEGDPDPRHISTSHVERRNLTMLMWRRRFTRLTNTFSKKLDNHLHALALYFVFYNFCRIHESLRTSPAVAAGVTDRLWSLEDVVSKIDELALFRSRQGREEQSFK